MADIRLYDPAVRIYLAAPEAFADWKNPTTAELNANPTNDPNGLIWNLTCAIDRADSAFDLDDAETDDSLSFCQVAGTTNPTSANANFVYSAFRAKNPWKVSDAASFNTANLAFSLMSHRGVEYFAIASLGRKNDEAFAIGDELKMGRVGSVDPVDSVGTGEMVKITQNWRSLGDINWNYTLNA